MRDITLLTLLRVLALSIVLVHLANRLRRWTVRKLLASSPLDLGTRQAIGAIVRYFVLAIGFLAIVQTVGINLTTFNVLTARILLGIARASPAVLSEPPPAGAVARYERQPAVRAAGVEPQPNPAQGRARERAQLRNLRALHGHAIKPA